MLTDLVGLAMTERFLEVMTRLQLEQVRGDGTRKKRSKKGVEWADRRSACAPMAPAPVRGEESEVVRAASILLVSLAVGLRPGQHRTSGPAVYLGDPTGRRIVGLSFFTGRSVRELERYLAAFRQHGLVEVWQPPAGTPGLVRAKSGHAYNVAEWRSIPHELGEHVRAWEERLRMQARRQANARAVAPRGRVQDRAQAPTALATTLDVLRRYAGDEPPS